MLLRTLSPDSILVFNSYLNHGHVRRALVSRQNGSANDSLTIGQKDRHTRYAITPIRIARATATGRFFLLEPPSLVSLRRRW
jgi:hypothetical protein